MGMVWTVRELAGMQDVARELLDLSQPLKVLCLHGELGAGKTTLVKAMCKELGVVDPVQSPTFSIVNEYIDAQGDPVYHFDFYRVHRIEEAYDLGYEQYVYSGYFCFIEWPEQVEGLPMPDKADVYIESCDGARIIRYEHI